MRNQETQWLRVSEDTLEDVNFLKKIIKNSQSGVFLFIFVEQLTPTPL